MCDNALRHLHNVLTSHILFGLLRRLQRHKRAKESMVVAMKILSSDNSMTHNTSSSTKYQDPSISSTYKSVDFHNPSNTTRPKSTYLFGHDDIDSAGISSVTVSPHAISARATMGEHIISHPIPKGSKLLKEKKKVSRSSTFRNKEKKEDKKEEKEKEKISGLVGVVHQQGGMVDNEKSRASEQLYVKCITALKTSLEEIMVRRSLYNNTRHHRYMIVDMWCSNSW